MRYGKSIGTKYHQDGSIRRFPGNTVVADVTPDCITYPIVTQVRDMIKNSPLEKYYAFLPNDSFHMTLFNGLNDQQRDETRWPPAFPKDATMEQADDFFTNAINAVKLPKNPRMKFREVSITDSTIKLLLDPADEEQNKILRAFRDRAAENIGLFISNHKNYNFHISLAYTYIIPEGEDATLLPKIKAEIDAILKKAPAFEIGEPYIAYFDDMNAFSPTKISRKA